MTNKVIVQSTALLMIVALLFLPHTNHGEIYNYSIALAVAALPLVGWKRKSLWVVLFLAGSVSFTLFFLWDLSAALHYMGTLCSLMLAMLLFSYGQATATTQLNAGSGTFTKYPSFSFVQPLSRTKNWYVDAALLSKKSFISFKAFLHSWHQERAALLSERSAILKQLEELSHYTKSLEERIRVFEGHQQESFTDNMALQRLLAQKDSRLSALERDNEEQRASIERLRQEYSDLEICNRALSRDWDHAQNALSVLQEAIAERKIHSQEQQGLTIAEQPAHLQHLLRRAAHYKGLWNQLKEQFEEKSMQLDLCRKELFSYQEELLVAQRERQEQKIAHDEMLLAQQSLLLKQCCEEAGAGDNSLVELLEELLDKAYR